MSISKITKLAGEALKAVKTLPNAGKAGLACIFGAGVATGSLINCDGFERETKPKTEIPADSTLMTVKTKPEETKKEEKKEPEFKYVSPAPEDVGAVKIDTVRLIGSNGITRRNYFDKEGNIVYIEHFKEGKTLDYYSILNSEGTYSHFRNGECFEWTEKHADGSRTIYSEDSKGRSIQTKYDKQGRVLEDEFYSYDDTYQKCKYTHNSDGSQRTQRYEVGRIVSDCTVDRNGREIERKAYDKNNQLKYTVTPKYNDAGDIVKRDTIWNKQ